MSEVIPDLLRRLAGVEQQRDELLEALKELLDAENSYPWSGSSESELAAIEKARAVIAKAEQNT